MSTHQVIGYTPEIGKALKRIMAETPQTDTGKLAYPNGKKQSTINTKAKASSGKFEYNGYFKIIDASERDKDGKITAYKVKVVDGATYDPETGHSGESPAYVNGVLIKFSTWLSETMRSSKYIRIHIVFKSDGKREAKIELSDYISPSNDATNVYWDIGRVFIINGVLSLQQDSFNIPRMDWFNYCE